MLLDQLFFDNKHRTLKTTMAKNKFQTAGYFKLLIHLLFFIMLSSISQAFLSFFNLKPPPTMAESLLLNPNSAMSTTQFLYNITSWASHSDDHDQILDRFQIICITHHKNLSSLEHEYLIIETMEMTKSDFLSFSSQSLVSIIRYSCSRELRFLWWVMQMIWNRSKSDHDHQSVRPN